MNCPYQVRCLTLLTILAMLSPQFARGQNAVAEGNYPDLAVDNAGNLHLVYGRGDQLYYRFYDAKAGRWTDEEKPPVGAEKNSFGLNRSDPDVVTDSQDRPHVFAWDSYAYRTDAGWVSVRPLKANSKGIRDAELAIDGDDNVFLTKRGGFTKGKLGVQRLSRGGDAFVPVTDPDAGLTKRDISNHVYTDLAVSPIDNSLHLIQRHGPQFTTAYRMSPDGGRTWPRRMMVSAEEPEAPHIAVSTTGQVFATTGFGEFFRLQKDRFLTEGFPLRCQHRDQPEISCDGSGNVFIASFGGKLNVRRLGCWIGESRLRSVTGAPIGFVEPVGGKRGGFVVWEEGDAVDHDALVNEPLKLFVARVSPLGQVRFSLGPATSKSQASSSRKGERISRFGLFEHAIKNPKSYKDPYRDVSLAVKIRSPYGRTYQLDGFFDGGKTWRFRFRAPNPGVYRFEARFSDSKDVNEGSFRVAHSTEPFAPVGINPVNPIWFKRGVQPLQLRALHIGDRFFASNWPQASRKKFLDWIQSQGYNTLSIASHFLNRDEADRGRDWKTPDLWPLNANEFQRMESILNDVHDRGLIVFPFAGFIGKNSDYPRDASDQEAYIRYTMSRLGHYGNLLYNVAGPEPNLKEDWFSDEDVNRLGRLIRDHDVYDHPLTVHNRTGDDPYRDSDWTTFGTLQGPKTVNRKKLHQGLMESHHPSKPLFAQETLWSGNMYHVKKRLGRDYSDDDIRKNAYVIHMSGANFCFADNQGNSSSGFSGSLDVDDAHPTRHQIINRVWDFFASIRYYEMSPRPDLVDEGFCLANPGKSYLVYLPEGGTVNLQMGLGNYRATWIHPNDTADRRDAGLTRHRGRFDAPSDGDDWLLLLTHQRTGLAEGIRLSWKDASDTTLTIAWKTDAPRAVGTRGLQNRVVASYRSLGQLEWREAKGNSKPMAGHGRLHRVTLRGLSPSTVYEYRLSNDDGLSPEWSDVHQSKTAPAANKPARFRVAFVADVGLSGRLDGNADGVEAVMQSVIEKNPTCVLGGGDYAYANRDGRFNSVGEAIDAFFEQYQPLLRRFPFQPQFGNHELKLVERIEDWSPQFSLPAGDPQSTSYSFDIADVHFTAFQLVDRPPTPEELAWLDQDLASARDRGQRWLVVYHHEPLYAYGRSHPSKTAIAEMVLPILEKHKVDLALNTHDQSYERTYPLIGHPSRPKVMASHPNRYLAGQGVVYCKVSPSGKRSEIGNTFSKFKVPQQDFMAVRDDTQHHYALIDFYESGQMVVTAYGIAPESQQEVIVDRFSVLQSIKP